MFFVAFRRFRIGRRLFALGGAQDHRHGNIVLGELETQRIGPDPRTRIVTKGGIGGSAERNVRVDF